MSEKRDEVKLLHELEQEGLRRAEDRDKKSKDDYVWFTKVQDAVNEHLKPYYHDMGEEQWESFARQLANAAYYGSQKAKTCQYSGENKEDCSGGVETWDYLAEADEIYGYLPDRPPPATSRCTHFVKSAIIESPIKYRLHHALNDVTACLHRNIEHYEEMARKWHKEGKCMWRE